ncbi:Alpha-(13)-fucosyltransferase fut-1 [Dissostichus eleginoides]|uniref:Alpha-(13)-fucosyltransferase fut-1 n=1 Tax=Dissostichus eleginoides TaxID=100907 RepID=A0AAD9EX28_DISEL|nr:Alpha-(13)-fucosyltransferase fut-1 [Dissostichus eleginoides]
MGAQVGSSVPPNNLVLFASSDRDFQPKPKKFTEIMKKTVFQEGSIWPPETGPFRGGNENQKKFFPSGQVCPSET